jgi:hypothetical protein
MAKDDPEGKRIGDINVSMGDGNRVGHIGHVIHGNVQRTLSDADKETLRTLPQNRSIEIESIHGDPEANRLAEEIANVLVQSGHKIETFAVSMFPLPTPQGVQVSFREDEPAKPIHILIGRHK